MKLYHGTTEEVARKALKEGIKPRIATGKSNWKHTVESNPSMVYLTAAYAPFFGMQAARAFVDEEPEKDFSFGLIEIDTELLDQRWLMPDEDFIEQATRSQTHSIIKGKNMKQRTEWVRNNIHAFHQHWETSVNGLGNCGYKGIIPPSAITRVSVVQYSPNREVIWAIDPCITTVNYRLVGEKYRELTRWFFKEALSIEKWAELTHLNIFADIDDFAKQAKEHWEKILSNQSGIEIIYSKQ